MRNLKCEIVLVFSENPIQLRAKIDTIISRSTPHPDPDAPECPESVRFWATSGGEFSEKERTRVTATASARVAPSATGLAGLVQHDVPSSGAPTPCGNGPTLRALVDVANNTESPGPEPTAKGKAKAKAKAKSKVAQVTPKTPAEQRVAIRSSDFIGIWFDRDNLHIHKGCREY